MVGTADPTAPIAPPAIRLVHQSDLHPLTQVWYNGWHEAHADHVPAALVLLRSFESLKKRLVAYGDDVRCIGSLGNPVGFCAIKGDEIDQIYVAPAARSTGAAKVLLADGEARLKARGITTARLICLPENLRAVQFYVKQGWTDCGVHSETVTTENGPFPLNCVLFTKAL